MALGALSRGVGRRDHERSGNPLRPIRTRSNDFKASIVAKLLPSLSLSIPQLVKKTGIPRDTLYGWRRQGAQAARIASRFGRHPEQRREVRRRRAERDAHELDLGAYCRQKGPFTEQLAA